MTHEPSRLQTLSRLGSAGPRPRSGRRAFNLIEMLVVMLLIGIFAGLTFSKLDRALPRIKLRGKATEVSGFLQKSRLQAIKGGLDITLEVETFGEGQQWLLAYRKNTDGSKSEVSRLNIGSPDSPFEPHLAGAEGGSEDASKAIYFGSLSDEDPSTEDPDILVFTYKPTGVTDTTGAYRISSGTLNRKNTIEVAVASLGGQPVLRKYIRPGDRPSTQPTVEFFEETHHGTTWDWTWY